METLMMPPRISFAERLRSLRNVEGWTLKELADRSGLHLQTIARIESGKIPNPGWDTVCALAAAFDIPTDSFRTEPERDELQVEDVDPPPRPSGKRK